MEGDLMYEQAKLAEARHFYFRMLAELNDREIFTYNLSAFLSSARSVMQYALEEAKPKTGGQQWYDSQMAASPVLSFFRDKRDINVHFEPLKPVQHTNIAVTTTVHLSASVSITHLDANGNMLYQSPPETHEPEPRTPDAPPVVTTRYRFADWADSENVMTLSQMYLDELQRVVEDGVRNGFLTA
jgi:hypothetical protein